MIYKAEAILARVFVTSSDLYSLKDDGSLNESLDIPISHNDPEIVWYEVDGLEAFSVERDGEELYFIEIPSIEEAKRRIDMWIDDNETN